MRARTRFQTATPSETGVVHERLVASGQGSIMTVRCNVAGVEAEDLAVEINGDQMVISGEYGQGSNHNQPDPLKRNKRDGYFIRTVYLPVQPGGGEAIVNNDVLEVNLHLHGSANQTINIRPQAIAAD